MRLVVFIIIAFFGHWSSCLSDVVHIESKSLTEEVSGVIARNDSPFQNLNTALISIEEQDAVAVEYLLIQSIKSVQLSLRLVSNVIRIIADTTAGALSTVVKGFGGLANLLSTLLNRYSNYLQNSTSPLGQKTSRNFGSASVLLKGVGDSCIYGGDIVEVMTQGMGEALQDSFGNLEYITRSLRYVVIMLLGQSHPQLPPITNPHLTNKYTQEEYDEIFKQQNSLYGHNRHWSETKENDNEYSDDAINLDNTVKSSLNKLYSTSKHTGNNNNNNKHNEKLFSKLKTAEEFQQSSVEVTLQEFLYQQLIVQWNKLYATASLYSSLIVSNVSKYVCLPVVSTLDVPSIGPYLLMGLLLMSIVNLVEYSSLWWRLLAILCTVTVLWYQIMNVEHSQRLRLVQRTSVKSIHSYLTRQTSQQQHASNLTTSNSTITRRSTRESHKAKPTPYENAVWLNVLIHSLWNVDQSEGLGKYVSSVYEEMLLSELAQISPGIVDIRVRNFDLGINPPLVKGIRMRSTRDKQCVAQLLKSGHLSADNTKVEEEQLSAQKMFMSLFSMLSNSSELSNSYTNNRKQLLNPKHSFRECDEIDLDLDFIYASQDMNVVMSMRHEDSKSVLPEISVTLSELFLAGQITFAMKMTPDYPFLGNATVFFIEHPSLDFRVSSVGGVDVLAIPMGFEWMNTTLNWMLSEYTAPFNTTIDLRHNLCPSCDAKPSLTTQELILKCLSKAQQLMITTAEGTTQWLQKVTARMDRIVTRWKPTVGSNNATESQPFHVNSNDKTKSKDISTEQKNFKVSPEKVSDVVNNKNNEIKGLRKWIINILTSVKGDIRFDVDDLWY